MQFKHPEFLYALFLLLIPIIVHLFQLRKFKKIAFTNVTFLKEAVIQTRKSSQIKKWLILFTRLLLLAALIFGFSQPFTSKRNVLNTEKETVIYIDNSFSMQAKGSQGELLKRAIQDVIEFLPNNETISIVTNNSAFKNITINSIKNDLLAIDYTSEKVSTKAAFLKSKRYFSNKNSTLKRLIFISDFQEDKSHFNLELDTLIHTYFIQTLPIDKNNSYIKNISLSETSNNSLKLKVEYKNNISDSRDVPISLYNNNKLIAKTSIKNSDSEASEFSLPSNKTINGKIVIDDGNLQFDNTFYFNINSNSKINILAINGIEDSFLKRLYKESIFSYQGVPETQFDYNVIDQQNLIILNELKTIPNALVSALIQFTKAGGSLIIIPSENADNTSYNALLTANGLHFGSFNTYEKLITTINFSHALYNNGVFEKEVRNFQYPKVNGFYALYSNNITSALSFEDQQPFLINNQNTYIFSAPLNTLNSNFKNSPLIVPTFFNIGKQSLKSPQPFYTIGNNNHIEIETTIPSDAVLTLSKDNTNLIPKQQYLNNKVIINTDNEPSEAGIYAIKKHNDTLQNISFNYSREESELKYRRLAPSKNSEVNNSISQVANTLKSETKVNYLWKWFVIFALALLIIEMLILKFFK
ncbi:BatA and WFA domain-containing protein [Tamlana fucoidanivorans]|uniref:Aerotolerance regulator N-terminal domain-containing protein n=1 Tax=Allotamlana fucoidanivorans TaxID=2583814 RepID=A0A5C4SH80_9FLAO|nr:BatA domain-containing protein [Tamlana fucoidanivorans]TNJ43088.1 hypothetical protein FGF67_12045 [Tamlana fucoidanivorans]